MRALRMVFLFLTAASACFTDSGVKRSVRVIGRAATAVFAVLFLVAEAMELMS